MVVMVAVLSEGDQSQVAALGRRRQKGSSRCCQVSSSGLPTSSCASTPAVTPVNAQQQGHAAAFTVVNCTLQYACCATRCNQHT